MTHINVDVNFYPVDRIIKSNVKSLYSFILSFIHVSIQTNILSLAYIAFQFTYAIVKNYLIFVNAYTHIVLCHFCRKKFQLVSKFYIFFVDFIRYNVLVSYILLIYLAIFSIIALIIIADFTDTVGK